MARSTSVFIALLWSITLVACSKDHELKSGEPTIVIPDGKVQVAAYYFPNWGSAILHIYSKSIWHKQKH